MGGRCRGRSGGRGEVRSAVAMLIAADAGPACGPKAGSWRHRLPRPGEHLRGVLAGPATAGSAAPPNLAASRLGRPVQQRSSGIDRAWTADVLLVYPRSHPAHARHADMRDSERCAEPSAPAVTPSAICTRLSPATAPRPTNSRHGRSEPRPPQPLPLTVSAAETASCGSAYGGCRRPDLAHAWPTDHSRRSDEPLPLHT
jgi:hypothetical protein